MICKFWLDSPCWTLGVTSWPFNYQCFACCTTGCSLYVAVTPYSLMSDHSYWWLHGAIVFRNQQSMTIEQQRELGKHFGPLHKHATYATPRRGDLDDVVGEFNPFVSQFAVCWFACAVVYSDRDSRPDLYAFSRAELFHSDVTYEVQPPGTTMLRLLTTPEVGNDTLWSSGWVSLQHSMLYMLWRRYSYSVYSSLSKPFQQYLESLSAIHSGFDQASSRTNFSKIPRREPIETIHPVVRVHPVTGMKSVFVNPGFVTRLVGVPKAESDMVLSFLKDCFAQQTDATARWRWVTMCYCSSTAWFVNIVWMVAGRLETSQSGITVMSITRLRLMPT